MLEYYRQESDEKCAQQWLVYADRLLGAVTKYVSNYSKQCNVGAVVFLVTLIDNIIVFAQVVKKVRFVELKKPSFFHIETH